MAASILAFMARIDEGDRRLSGCRGRARDLGEEDDVLRWLSVLTGGTAASVRERRETRAGPVLGCARGERKGGNGLLAGFRPSWPFPFFF